MLGLSKKEKAEKRAREQIVEQRLAVGRYADIDVFSLPEKLTTTLNILVRDKASDLVGESYSKQDLASLYMWDLAIVLHQAEKLDEADRCLHGLIRYIADHKENISTAVYAECARNIQKTSPK